MIFNNNGASDPLQQFNPSTLSVDNKQKINTERKGYIELARFIFGDNWQFTKYILTFVCGYLSDSDPLTLKVVGLLGVGTDLAFAYRSVISGKHMMGESRYTSMEQQISESDIYATLETLRLERLPSGTTDINRSATNPPRVIKLMKSFYDDAQWEFIKLAIEWGFDRSYYTWAKVTRLHKEGIKVAEECRRLLASKNIEEEEVNRTLRNYLDENCFDINEADVGATLDIVQAWDYYMSRDGDKISKFLDDVRNVDKY
ncbi:uncharacterized protein EAE97_007367 [Botrytis byssoidea]|uniref:Uncharacterized protein n=1 Tax=Botrytis byssoidea TaxID=139641 RepID=A0A9P5INL3_9HELO|nr:uncharacterized protein EAE97_007367 [Botrytis byssoidea]KAF7939287.1 hypothetical protein EAE97_007367 [Botrytis byssoidea]